MPANPSRCLTLTYYLRKVNPSDGIDPDFTLLYSYGSLCSAEEMGSLRSPILRAW
jgi:hypothetical protein